MSFGSLCICGNLYKRGLNTGKCVRCCFEVCETRDKCKYRVKRYIPHECKYTVDYCLYCMILDTQLKKGGVKNNNIDILKNKLILLKKEIEDVEELLDSEIAQYIGMKVNEDANS
mgnify:CR=1 FL=1